MAFNTTQPWAEVQRLPTGGASIQYSSGWEMWGKSVLDFVTCRGCSVMLRVLPDLLQEGTVRMGFGSQPSPLMPLDSELQPRRTGPASDT